MSAATNDSCCRETNIPQTENDIVKSDLTSALYILKRTLTEINSFFCIVPIYS